MTKATSASQSTLSQPSGATTWSSDPWDAGDGLVEHERVLWDRHPRLGGVLAVVEADRDELAYAGYRGADTRVCGHDRHLLEVDRRDGAQLLRGEPVRRDVRNEKGKVALDASAV